MTRFLFVLLLFCLVSCSLFRKSKSEFSAVAMRDSMGRLELGADWSRLILLKEHGRLVELDARGFRSIRVDSAGGVETEGEDGSLVLRNYSRDSDFVLAEDSGSRVVVEAAVSDSTAVESSEESEANADPDTWFNWWWVLVIGAVLVIVGKSFADKFDIKKWFK